MKTIVLSMLALLVSAAPVMAQKHGHRSMTRHHAHAMERGMPITAAGSSVRINSAGEVISQPAPVIQKESSFDTKARRELSKPTSAKP